MIRNRNSQRSAMSIIDLGVILFMLGVLLAIAIPKYYEYTANQTAHGIFKNQTGIINAIEAGDLGVSLKLRATRGDGLELRRNEIEGLQQAVYSVTDSVGVYSIIVDEDKLHVLCMATATDFKFDEVDGKHALSYIYSSTDGIYVFGEGVRATDPVKAPPVEDVKPVDAKKDS